ncbi:hypothetical protein RCL1_002988 [Eukaryota sp. TZLM3-RCL]
MIYLFKHPLIRSVKWEKAIDSSKGFKPKLVEITTVRDQLVRVLSDKRPAAEIVSAVESYLPFLYSLVAVGEEIKTTRHCSILWSSCVSRRTLLSESSNVNFEVIMTHITYSYAMSVLAHGELMNGARENTFHQSIPLALKHLLKAAGVVRSLKQAYANLLHVPPDRPVEAIAIYGEALSLLYQAEAQALVVLRAEEAGTARSVVARLCMEVYAKSAETLKTLQSLRNDYNELLPDFITHIEELGNLFKAKAFRFLGGESYKVDQCGEAVAYLKLARDHFSTLSANPNRPNFYANVLSEEKKNIEDELHKYQTELSLVFFQSVPNPVDLKVPDPVGLCEPVDFAAPEPIFDKIE